MSIIEMLEYYRNQLYNILGLVIEKFIVKYVALIVIFIVKYVALILPNCTTYVLWS